MRELIIGKNEAGQRFDKYLKKYLKEAPNSFIYKMIRKKNIVINDAKATPEQMLVLEDCVKLYLAEETIEKFQGNGTRDQEYIKAYELFKEKISLIYEDEHILVWNKPSGILSQKAQETDTSVNEFAIGYLMVSKQLTNEELETFRPSICNRLDRNTSGLIIVGKSLHGLQSMAEMIQKRSVHKFYYCIVEGCIQKANTIEGFLQKNAQNKVNISNEQTAEDAVYIKTKYHPIWYEQKYSFLEVELITGKTHQIRAHLSSIGHPIVGDTKYGSKESGVRSQLLHAARLEFPDFILKATMPPSFYDFVKVHKELSWQLGAQED